jgi:hypothetical protein
VECRRVGTGICLSWVIGKESDRLGVGVFHFISWSVALRLVINFHCILTFVIKSEGVSEFDRYSAEFP